MIRRAVADELGRERAPRLNAQASVAKIIEHSSHQTIGHALPAKLLVGFDMTHHKYIAVSSIVGDGDQPILDVEFVALTLRVVDDRVLHPLSVPRNVDLTAALIP